MAAAGVVAGLAAPGQELATIHGETLLTAGGGSGESKRIAAGAEMTYGRRRCRPGCRTLAEESLLSDSSVSTPVLWRLAME